MLLKVVLRAADPNLTDYLLVRPTHAASAQSAEVEMSSKRGNVQILDVRLCDQNPTAPGENPGQIRQTREVWKISGWGFRATREHIETSVQTSAASTDDSNDRD